MPDYAERLGSRVLLVDPEDRLLLFRATLDDGQILWFPPGGGVEGSESFEDAARRELWEECGIDLSPSGCVWRQVHESDDAGVVFAHRPMRFIYQFYFHRVAEQFEPHPQAIGEWEDYMRQDNWYRWLRIEEIEALPANTVTAPRDLTSLLRPLLTGHIPAMPLEIGL